jgi:hypothetical protein
MKLRIVVIIDGAARLRTRLSGVDRTWDAHGRIQRPEVDASLAGERVSALALCAGQHVAGVERLRDPASSSRNLDSDPDRSADRGASDSLTDGSRGADLQRAGDRLGVLRHLVRMNQRRRSR